MIQRHRVQVVHDLEARHTAEVIDRGDIEEHVEAKLRVVAQKATGLDDLLAGNDHSRVAAKRMRVEDRTGDALTKAGNERMLCHLLLASRRQLRLSHPSLYCRS